MISDERLREAARKVEESMLASLPDPEECKVPPPPEVERKIKKRTHRASHPIRHRVIKAVACFFLVVLVGVGSVLALSADARAAFVTWVKEVYETQFIYRFFQTSEETSNDTLYRPTWIPSDYQISSESESNSRTTIIYKDNSGNLAVFTYFLGTASPVFQIEQDSIETYSQVYVNGMSAELYLDKDEGEPNVLIWLDESKGVVFRISAPFGQNDLIKMAESVTNYKS